MSKLDGNLTAEWLGCPMCLKWLARQCEEERQEILREIKPQLNTISELGQAKNLLEWRAYNSELILERRKNHSQGSNRDPWGCPRDLKGSWGDRKGSRAESGKLNLSQKELDDLDL